MRKLLIIYFKLTLISILFHSSCYTHAQENRQEASLTAVDLINVDLQSIIDSIMEHEKKCEYYTPELVFEILLKETNDTLNLQISAVGKQMYKIGYERGILKYKDHLFFVSGKLDNRIFLPTKEKFYYKYKEVKDEYDPKADSLMLISDDDSYSYWGYKYIDEKFVFDYVSTYCNEYDTFAELPIGFDTQPECCYTENLISGNVNIKLPCCYKLKKTNYDEGVFLIFNYKDSTAVTIFDGMLISFPFFKEQEGYIPCKIDTVENRIITSGIKKNKFWREDVITNRIRVMYVNVPSRKKEIYDEVLNSFYLSYKEEK